MCCFNRPIRPANGDNFHCPPPTKRLSRCSVIGTCLFELWGCGGSRLLSAPPQLLYFVNFFEKYTRHRRVRTPCPPSELDRRLAAGPVAAYLGFDATADSLHVGSLLQIMILRHLQRCGHRPVVLVRPCRPTPPPLLRVSEVWSGGTPHHPGTH